MDGVLVIDKPAGPTSFDVVRRLRSLGTGKKAGHAGTLDPAATGVLPVCLGDATKIAGFLLEGDKVYEGVVRFGIETDTYDATGKVIAEEPTADIDLDRVREALATFQGSYWQTPPMYSAVKVEGRRLYELAREGEEVERKPRKITVHEIELLAFEGGRARIRLRCSKGTYVRSIAHDLGQALGTGGHLAELRRLESGPFRLEQAVTLSEAMGWARAKQAPPGRLVSMREALAGLPEVQVDAAGERKVSHGMVLGGRELAAAAAPRFEEGQHVRICSGERLLAVGEYRDGGLRYARVLVGPPAVNPR